MGKFIYTIIFVAVVILIVATVVKMNWVNTNRSRTIAEGKGMPLFPYYKSYLPSWQYCHQGDLLLPIETTHYLHCHWIWDKPHKHFVGEPF